MKRTNHRLCIVIGCLLACTQASPAYAKKASCERLIASGNPEYPPFLWQDPLDDKRLIGANAELMQLLSAEIGMPIETRYVGPWGRVQETARAGRIDLISGAFLTQPRLQYLRYYQPAIQDTRSLVWISQNSKLEYHGWHDLVGKEGITVVNNSFGQEFDQFAASNLNIHQVGSLKNAMRMLQLGRADYLIYEDAPGLAYAASLGISNLRTMSPPISSEKLYLTMSLNSHCNQDQINQRIAAAMKKFNEQKVMPGLVEKYIRLWQNQFRIKN